MDDFYLDGNPLDEAVSLYDSSGNLVEQFYGRDALHQAYEWVRQHALSLRATINPEDMNTYNRSFYRRNRPRLHIQRLRLLHHSSRHSARVNRIIIDFGDEFFEDDLDEYFADFADDLAEESTDWDSSRHSYDDDNVELVPSEELMDEE